MLNLTGRDPFPLIPPPHHTLQAVIPYFFHFHLIVFTSFFCSSYSCAFLVLLFFIIKFTRGKLLKFDPTLPLRIYISLWDRPFGLPTFVLLLFVLLFIIISSSFTSFHHTLHKLHEKFLLGTLQNTLLLIVLLAP